MCRRLFKSRFSVVLLSLAYIVCLIILVAMTFTQWSASDQKHDTMLKDGTTLHHEELFAELAGPVGQGYPDVKQFWGWPKNNSWFRSISFLLLSISMVISWSLLGLQKHGCVWKFNLLFMFFCIAMCFR